MSEDIKVIKLENEEIDDFLDDDDDASQNVSEESSEETASVASGGSSSTIQLLSSDPLFLILSEYFVTKNGKNMVTILEEINQNLARLAMKN